MNYEQFNSMVSSRERSVVLLEGTRTLPEADADILTAFAQWLAGMYPHAIFRTGNADGSDSAFARGVVAVDPARLEYVLPYAGHRNPLIAADSYRIAMSELPRVAEDRAVYQTLQASPEYETMLEKRKSVPRLRAKANYILRDTVKVIGVEERSLQPATVGIFYVNSADPMAGGTGHTIRVCQRQGVPVAFQEEWMQWVKKAT